MTAVKHERAIVLGGGGITGIAWEVGVLSGLQAEGVDLTAGAVFGTSAGSFVGAALRSGNLDKMYASLQVSAPDEGKATVSKLLFAAWTWAFIQGLGKPKRVGAGFGAVARRYTPMVSEEERRRAVAGRMVTTDWPDRLYITATDAKTGVLRAFDQTCGYPLAEVVSASGAVPGISPAVRLGDRQWIDAGMVSSANARLADGYERVLVLAPLPQGHGGIPSVAKDVQALQRSARAELIVPDSDCVTAIGPNIYDPDRRGEVVVAATRQGRLEAPRIAALWRRGSGDGTSGLRGR
jgi:NTE family protein